MENQNKYKKSKKGTILLLITSLGFLLASVWMMESQIKPQNIGSIEFTVIKLGNEGQNNLWYIDKAAEYSLNNSLGIKSRNYKSEEKTYTNQEVCKLQIQACREKKPGCETNLKLFCEDEVSKAFKEFFTKYLDTFNKETNNNININDYEITVKVIQSEISAKLDEIEVVGKAAKNLQAKEGGVEYSIKPNFRTRIRLN